jgi:hypothetical protein
VGVGEEEADDIAAHGPQLSPGNGQLASSVRRQPRTGDEPDAIGAACVGYLPAPVLIGAVMSSALSTATAFQSRFTGALMLVAMVLWFAAWFQWWSRHVKFNAGRFDSCRGGVHDGARRVEMLPATMEITYTGLFFFSSSCCIKKKQKNRIG